MLEIVGKSKLTVLVLGLLIMSVSVSALVSAQEELLKAEQPALITSAGQAPDAFQIKVIADSVGLKYKYDPLAGEEMLEGTKTLILAVGASLKGLGDAGINFDQELSRIENLIAKALERGIQIIAIHMGGEARRDDRSNQIIQLVGPQVDYWIVREEGNKDGLFTEIAAGNPTPLTIIAQTFDLIGVFVKVFL
ncbi:MAG: DUF6305 family protein [Thermodesulfobacteriota bacterium]